MTVAFPRSDFWSIRRDIGLPTIRLRPRTTTCLPEVGVFVRLRSSTIPAGVHAVKASGFSWHNLPRFSAQNPSTSLVDLTRLKTSV